MSNHDADTPRQSYPQRPRHQISRSITELSSPIRLHRSHNHRHPSIHRRKDPYRDDSLLIPQTAAPSVSGRASFEGFRSERASPNPSPYPSRRPSVFTPSSDENGQPAAHTAKSRKMPLTEEEARLEREQAADRLRGLTQSLVDLSTFSSETSQRLDDTYYSVLEKLSALQNTVIALGELAGMSAEVNEAFEKDANGLVSEVEGQLDSFGRLDEQRERVAALQDRVRRGRERVQALSERVDAVKDRIEGWERADAAWQERTRRRLKTAWVLMSGIVLVLALLFAAAQYASPSPVADLEDATVRFANESMAKLRNATGGLAGGVGGGGEGGSDSPWDAGEAGHKTLNLSAEKKPFSGGDETLHVFDEL